MEQEDSFGLVSLGKAGEFTVEVLSRPDVGWLLSVESSNWCFTFDLDGRCAVADLATFLRSHAGREEFAELTVGSFGGASVRVVKDDEFAERFFIRAAGGGLLVEFTLVGGIMREFAVAVAEAAEEFEAEAEPVATPNSAAPGRAMTWAVWRIDDNANTFLVRGGLSREEAERLSGEFTARGHKQTYWVEPEVDAEPGATADGGRDPGPS